MYAQLAFAVQKFGMRQQHREDLILLGGQIAGKPEIHRQLRRDHDAGTVRLRGDLGKVNVPDEDLPTLGALGDLRELGELLLVIERVEFGMTQTFDGGVVGAVTAVIRTDGLGEGEDAPCVFTTAFRKWASRAWAVSDSSMP